MSTSQRIALLIARIALGGLFFYAGLTKLLDPAWSAAGYIASAQHFTALYAWLGSPAILPLVNVLNAWGLTLLGISLILGAFVRISASLGIVIMLLYYLVLDFPYPNEHAFIIDEHIVYAAVLVILIAFKVGRVWGLDSKLHAFPLLRRLA